MTDSPAPHHAAEPECPFCKRIAAGEYDEEPRRGCYVFPPLNPVTPGHLLVVPGEHVRDASVAPATASAVMFQAAMLVQRLGGAANIITSIGALATQSVYHLHVHVVPRREDDGLPLPWTLAAAPPRPSAATVKACFLAGHGDCGIPACDCDCHAAAPPQPASDDLHGALYRQGKRDERERLRRIAIDGGAMCKCASTCKLHAALLGEAPAPHGSDNLASRLKASLAAHRAKAPHGSQGGAP